MLIFPDREVAKILKICFRQLLYLIRRDTFEVLKIKGCDRVIVGCNCNLLNFEAFFVFEKKTAVKKRDHRENTGNMKCRFFIFGVRSIVNEDVNIQKGQIICSTN